MGIRESLNRLNPFVIGGAAVAALLLAAFIAYASLRSRPPAGMDESMALKCSTPNCDATASRTHQHVLKNQTLGEQSPGWPGLRCEKCDKDTLAAAWQCPNDKVIFFRRPQPGHLAPNPDAEELHCPTCNWDPMQKHRDEIKKLTAKP